MLFAGRFERRIEGTKIFDNLPLRIDIERGSELRASKGISSTKHLRRVSKLAGLIRDSNSERCLYASLIFVSQYYYFIFYKRQIRMQNLRDSYRSIGQLKGF